jgi:3-oxoadipate enol-lactonase
VSLVWKSLGAVGLGWVAWRLFGPELAPAHGGKQERPLHIPGRTVLVGEQEHFVRQAGPESGPPLVLIHGWGFDGEMTFYKLIPALAERHRVIVVDLRNHGKSDRIRGPVDVADFALETIGVLDVLGCDGFDVFGYSLGGMAAQVLAHRHPDRVRRLVLGGTAACPVDRFRVPVRLALWVARAVARLSKKEAVIFTYRLLLRSGVVEGRHARWLWAAMLNRDPTLFYEAGKAAWRFDSRPWVGQIGVPTMMIIPTRDRIVRTETQYELAELLGADRVVEIAGAGHESVLSHPQEYITAIESFLTDV